MSTEFFKNSSNIALTNLITDFSTVVWTAIDSIAENFVVFFLQPLPIKSKASAYIEHLLQNVVDFALITKAFM